MTDQSGNNDSNEAQIVEMLDEARGLIEHFGGLVANFHVSVLHGVEITLPDVNELFRVMHTLKGVSHIAGLPQMVELLHKVEDFIDAVRNGKSSLRQDEIETLGDVQHLCEMAFSSYPLPLSDEQGAECQRLGTFFQQLGNKAAEPAALPDPAASSEPATPVTGTPQNLVAEGGLAQPDAAENAAFARVCGRNSDNLFAAVFPGDRFPNLEAMQADDAVQNAGRLGEPILMRHTGDAYLFLFGSDLDLPMACVLLDTAVVALEKTPTALVPMGTPWDALSFAGTGTAVTAGPGATTDAGSAASASAAATPVPVTAGHPASASNSAPAPAAAEIHAEACEDFDTQNLAPGRAAEGMDLEPEMLQDFLVNADELLEQLAQSMLQLESEPENKDAIESIFRAAHTIKGTAGMFGFRAVEKLTHVMENLFDHIRKGERTVTPEMVDALLFALDQVRGMFNNCKAGRSPELPINEALGRLTGNAAAPRSASKSAASPAPAPASPSAATSAAAPSAALEAPRAPAVAPSAAASSASSGGVSAGTVVAKADARPPAGEGGEGGANKTPNNQGGTIRVDLNRLDSLVNLVGELVIDRTRFAEIEDELRRALGNGDLGSRMSESVLLFTRHMNEVQNVIMKIRMVPIGNAFYRFNRVVRDLARQLEKEIELEILGGDTELDKTLVEDIGDPLVHLIRNSVDHGIEMPADRLAAGKSKAGKLTVSAAQDGNMIVISVADNGRGLQVEKLRAKAVERGIIKESDQLSNKEVFNLIFEAGFSTAEKVTNISGRGVGMDVVKKSILKLKGIIDIDSEVGRGTCVTIKLPLTLAIIPSLMVDARGETYAIPLVNVIESIRISPEELQSVAGRPYVTLRDGVLQLMSLSDSFKLDGLREKRWYRNDEVDHGSRHGRVREAQCAEAYKGEAQGPQACKGEAEAAPSTTLPSATRGRSDRRRKQVFVVLGVGEHRVGVFVDALLGQQEIVIKPLGAMLGKVPGVAGGCVLGNGRVALVLDASEIIDDMPTGNVQVPNAS